MGKVNVMALDIDKIMEADVDLSPLLRADINSEKRSGVVDAMGNCYACFGTHQAYEYDGKPYKYWDPENMRVLPSKDFTMFLFKFKIRKLCKGARDDLYFQVVMDKNQPEPLVRFIYQFELDHEAASNGVDLEKACVKNVNYGGKYESMEDFKKQKFDTKPL